MVFTSCSPKQGTVRVRTHQGSTMVSGDFIKGWGQFPSPKEKVRRVFMHVTLGHPDTLAIAHWDYLDFIYIRRVQGRAGKDLKLELGRMLTPYGSNFEKGWQWTWTVDVTDYASLLRDSVEIEYHHTGYEPAHLGWSLDIEFEIIYGTPVADLVRYDVLHKGSFPYGNSKKPLREALVPRSFEIGGGAVLGCIRIQHTGHGMDGSRGCSEFCSRWRKILLDGKTIDKRDMWKECADNPLYPQGGTWIFDRAYWCPGDLQEPDMIFFPLTKGQHEIAIEIEPSKDTQDINAQENISSIFFQYQKPNHAHDVALAEVVVPNNAPKYHRLNPVSGAPYRIVVQNMGYEPLTSLEIHYGESGKEPQVAYWEGNLSFYQKEEILLSEGALDLPKGMKSGEFSVELVKPNNRSDEWEGDNRKTVAFDAPPRLPEKMIVHYKTNLAPRDNHVVLSNSEKKILREWTPSSTVADSLYVDTFTLREGHYQIGITDTADNGLEFWFMPQYGYGYLRLLDMEGKLLHVFESDFGKFESFAFSTDKDWSGEGREQEDLFILFPRVVKKYTTLDVLLAQRSDVEIKVLADGKEIEKQVYKNVMQGAYPIDLSSYAEGRYVIEVFVNGKSAFKRRIHKRTNN